MEIVISVAKPEREEALMMVLRESRSASGIMVE